MALYIRFGEEDHVMLNKLAANAGALKGKPVTVSDVVRQLVRDAAARGKPVRVTIERGREKR